MTGVYKPLLIVADDDPIICQSMQYLLESWNYRVTGVRDAVRLLQVLDQERPSALLLDLQFGDVNGLDLLQKILATFPGLPIIILTANASIDTAVTAIKAGAHDYLTKPPDVQRMRGLLRKATQLESVKGPSRSEMEDPQADVGLWGDSTPMRQVKSLISNVAPTEATVLILGESGTGKELVARALHEQSERQKGPFIPVNMAALPRELVESTLFGHEKGSFTGAVQAQLGCCEAADNGTLFLDEIGEMDLSLQSKLLRFLQERVVARVGSNKPRPVNVRVVAATNRDLLHQVHKGAFREDLYYRLNVVPVVLPGLRDRREDIPLLATRFLHRFTHKYHKQVQTISPDAMFRLKEYDWPGNVRQLENLVERLVILSSGMAINERDLPPELKQPTKPILEFTGKPVNVSIPTPLPSMTESGLRRIDEIEKRAICEALRKSSGNVREAALILGLGQATVYRKIKKYNLSPGSYSIANVPLGADVQS